MPPQTGGLSWCAVSEHELYHCAQARTKYGAPRFIKGKPVFSIRGHDVEEFVGVVQRYGAVGTGVADLAAAAGRAPEIGRAGVAAVCGTCLRLVA